MIDAPSFLWGVAVGIAAAVAAAGLIARWLLRHSEFCPPPQPGRVVEGE